MCGIHLNIPDEKVQDPVEGTENRAYRSWFFQRIEGNEHLLFHSPNDGAYIAVITSQRAVLRDRSGNRIIVPVRIRVSGFLVKSEITTEPYETADEFFMM
jgi:hypothetical protein